MPRLITVVQAVSQASLEIGIVQRPVGSAIGTADQDIAQMVALLSAVAEEALGEEPYQETLGDGLWLRNAATGALSDVPQNDTDQILFDGRLAVNGLKFRFLKAKGLEFGEELRDFSNRMNKLAAKANSRVLDLYDEADGGRMQ
jgi:hypothetical protein